MEETPAQTQTRTPVAAAPYGPVPALQVMEQRGKEQENPSDPCNNHQPWRRHG